MSDFSNALDKYPIEENFTQHTHKQRETQTEGEKQRGKPGGGGRATSVIKFDCTKKSYIV